MNQMSAEVAAAILGVAPDATREQIDTAWKARARVLHPDRFDSGSKAQETATESMKQLNTARDTMVEYLEKPRSKSSSSTSSSNSNNNASNASKQPSGASTSASEPQYRNLTPEEEEEERKAFRVAQMEEEKDVLKIISKTFAIHASLLLISIIASLYCLLNIVSSNGVYYQFGIAIAGTATFLLWNRTLVRWRSIIEVSRNISAIRSISRKEERAFNKYKRKNNKNNRK